MRAARLIVGLFLLWFGLVAWSFVDLATRAPSGDGFVRGINRLEGFLAWQLGALTTAGLCLLAGHLQPQGLSRRVRRMTTLPLLETAGLWVLIVAGGVALFLLEQGAGPRS